MSEAPVAPPSEGLADQLATGGPDGEATPTLVSISIIYNIRVLPLSPLTFCAAKATRV